MAHVKPSHMMQYCSSKFLYTTNTRIGVSHLLSFSCNSRMERYAGLPTVGVHETHSVLIVPQCGQVYKGFELINGPGPCYEGKKGN